MYCQDPGWQSDPFMSWWHGGPPLAVFVIWGGMPCSTSWFRHKFGTVSFRILVLVLAPVLICCSPVHLAMLILMACGLPGVLIFLALYICFSYVQRLTRKAWFRK